MKRSTRWAGLLALMALACFLAAWVASRRSHPELSSLLELIPADADVVAVVDMPALESNPLVKELLADPPDLAATADYQQLLRESGFHYQDDLKQLAAAKLGEDWAGAAVVHIDRARMVRYLESQGAAQSQQGDRIVYSFGRVRPFRLTFLKDNLIGFAVGADPALLGAVLDRFDHRASGSFMDAVRRGDYAKSAPAGAGLWLVAGMDRLLAANPQGAQIGPFQFGKEWLEGSKTLVARLEAGPLTLNLRVEDACENAPSAERIAGAFQAVLAILRAVPGKEPEKEQASKNPNYGVLLSTLAIEQADKSVVATWHFDPRMLVLALPKEKPGTPRP